MPGTCGRRDHREVRELGMSWDRTRLTYYWCAKCGALGTREPTKQVPIWEIPEDQADMPLVGFVAQAAAGRGAKA